MAEPRDDNRKRKATGAASAALSVFQMHLALAADQEAHGQEPESDGEGEAAASRSRRRLQEAGSIMFADANAGMTEAQKARGSVVDNLLGRAISKVGKLLPTIGRGMSEANAEASRKRRPLTCPYPGGIYSYLDNKVWVGESDGFRQETGFSQQEFDDFYDEVGVTICEQARNHYGVYTDEQNATRRKIKGILDDRDTVIVWLMMLRKDWSFHEMADRWGPSKGTFHNIFKWHTYEAARSQALGAVSIS